MIRGVRRLEEAQGLGLSRRLLVRVGALLKQGVEVSAAVLEAAGSGSPHEALLLDPALLKQAARLDEAAFQALAAQQGTADSGADALALREADGVRVICLREELEAEGAWEREPEVPAAPDPDAAARPLLDPESIPSGAALARRSLGASPGAAKALFSAVEIGRLRLKLATSADSALRVEALRMLAHAPLPPNEKVELFFRALDDRDAKVRSEAAGLLFVLGLGEDLGETLQALNQDRAEARMRAAERLAKRLSKDAKQLEQAAVAVCALAILRGEPARAFAARLIGLLTHCAPALAATPPRLSELIRVVLGLWAAASARGSPRADSAKLFSPMLRLFRTLIQNAARVAVPILHEERRQTSDPAVESFLLQMLLEASPRGAPEEPELLAQCAAYLARDTQEGRDSRALGMSLGPRGEAALHPLAETFPGATSSAQKYFLRLMDEILRYQEVSEPAKERAGELLLQAAGSNNRGVRMIAMQCRFASDSGLSETLREKLAEAFLGSIADFGFQQDIEIVEDNIARMGVPAIGPLSKRLPRERPAAKRIQAIRILGKLGLELKPRRGRMKPTREALTGLLRRLQALSAERDFPDRRTLFSALGQLAASPAATKQAAAVVSRNLLKAVRSDLDNPSLEALEGLSWVAASRRAAPELIVTVTGLLRRLIEQVPARLSARTLEIDGENVIEIEDEGGLVDVLPVALSGLSRIARSRSCPPALVRETVRLLASRFRKITAGEVIWGPGNAMLLIRALREIGCHEDLGGALCMELLKALAPRLAQPLVRQAIGAILAAQDTPETCAAALSVGLAVAGQRRADGRYEPEDRSEILHVLALIAARRHLGKPGPASQARALRFRETVMDDLFQGAQDLVPGAYEGLVRIREAGVLPEEQRQALEKRMTEFHTVKLYDAD